MALVGKITQYAPIPHEDGAWFELRGIPWVILKEAKKARVKDALGIAEALAEMTPEAREVMRSSGDSRPAPAATQAAPDLDDEYDRGVILRAGIAAWSYDDPVTPETIASLDERTADWAFRELLKPVLLSQEDRFGKFFRAPQGA